jgi:hypothetical protein
VWCRLYLLQETDREAIGSALNFWEGKGDCSDGPAEMESPGYNILPLEGPAMIENAAMNFPEVR